jgi:hypothetical protein
MTDGRRFAIIKLAPGQGRRPHGLMRTRAPVALLPIFLECDPLQL